MIRLSGDYNRGYTKAILDIMTVTDYVNYDLKLHHKTLNYANINKMLKCCLENREDLRESEMLGLSKNFVRWNTQLNDFEFYKGEN